MTKQSDLFLGETANRLMAEKLGGLNIETAIDACKGLLEAAGDATVKVADKCGMLPGEDAVKAYFLAQVDRAGLRNEFMEISADMSLFGTVWKAIDRQQWEHFCVPSGNHDISRYRPLIEAVRTDDNLYRAVQGVAEYSFPNLYLLRMIALGITASDEDWIARAKINTFRTFFLRLALPGHKYDRFVNYYVILTGQKDIWDELRSGQDSKLDFLIESVVNITSTQLAGYFEQKFSRMLSKAYAEIGGNVL